MAVTAAMNQSGRRVVYGVNVLLSAAISIALVVVLVWLAGQYRQQVDLTRTGVNSLAPRTVNLVRDLPESISITALYTVLTEYDQIAQRRQDTVRDLLRMYEGSSRGKIVAAVIDPMKEPARITALLQKLREKPAYKDEAKPHEAALQSFPPLNKGLIETASADLEQFKRFAEAQPSLAQLREFVIVANNLQRVARDGENIEADLADLLKGDIPRYGRAVREVRDYLTRARTLVADCMGWMTGDAVSARGVTPDAAGFFKGASERYQPLLTQIDELLKQTENLERVKLEDAYESLSRWASASPILVESATEARVLSMEDVWPFKTEQGATTGPDPQRDFAGEQAISSAILQLTQKTKTAVVFVRYGGTPLLSPDFSNMNPMMMRQMPRAPFQGLNELLEKNNFITQEWDLSGQKTPPPVEGAARTVYVVMPPETPPQQPNPMQPQPQGGITPQDKQILADAVDASGMGLFLTGWSEPAGQMMPMPGTYEYAEYLKNNWGVDVRFSFLTLEFAASPQDPQLFVPANARNPLLVTTERVRFTDHPITQPLKSVPAGFQQVAPLQVVTGEGAPAGVKVDVLAEVPATEDVWAFENIQRVQEDLQKKMGTFRRPDDVKAPFPIAVAATKENKRLVVISSERFADDQMLTAMGAQPTASGLQLYALYPANIDLFLNTLHWLTGDADRIAVGPRKADVPRLDKLTEGPTANFCRVFLVAIWPAIVLLIGGGVWLFRRR